ncbi:shufflon system plasmid conjugative transfer pilus tip adhesin PilV [Salmonella enterica subsp. enterica serovar Typhimurium]|uniref:Shufflon system plasmid conjugative transfer pilus tip adhesin PilV n=1 Tax=Salmonella enterica TaxID=28901 RepID=A0A5Z3T584_SALER|nr:shufflon system plasmid conjugative transfer pilus tip adhesin PilV [Salmonella enterica]EBO5292948.1 shufflon system plasmid conjugative transfer pilus tip adhesin PilV [Salmonella enterica subsp. enterica serovar Typhimurium]ECE6625704.1 shufflon system plasmid conjugative transfer pilus tip adhesin PilV [Salmonella enterica subsp. diarizonae]EDF8426198.1 shufflon system plasmid conjugative transfer pilus tip adhesin PilV [Salmonella enterica subsp. enterica serovar Montevideo]EDH6337900.1
MAILINPPLKRGMINITDAAIGIGVLFLIMGVIVIPMNNWLSNQAKAIVAATQAKRVQKAVQLYIKDNHSMIASTATASTPYIFGVSRLISAGYLPTGFSTTNGFGATYQTRVFEPTADKLQSMTYLAGGARLSKSQARKVAIGIGAEGGIIDGNTAKGALGSWSVALSSFGGYNPGDGSVVIAGFYDHGISINDYLYRKSVPGHPELNTMSTSLNMGNNNITNAATTTTTTLNATDVNARTTRTEGETYTGGWFRTTGDTGWYSEKHGGGIYMTDNSWVRVYNDKNFSTGGQIKGGTVRADGRLYAGEALQLEKVYTAGSGCSPNGLIGRDASGGILSCQSGVWKSSEFSFRVAGTYQVWPGQTVNLGRFKLCINTYRIDGREMALTELIPTDGPDSNGNMNWRAYNGTQYSAYYMGIHCFI